FECARDCPALHSFPTRRSSDLDGVKVRITDSFTTPWRTLQIAKEPTELITSYLILNLNEPNKFEDTSWIKPFKYIGIWWGMHIGDRKSTRLNSSHVKSSYAVFC